MKAIYPIIILAGALCSLAPAGSPTTTGPAVVAVHGVSRGPIPAVMGPRTNIVRGITNFTYVFKSTSTNYTIDAASLLALLENSFNTNFPTGSQLLLSDVDGPIYAFVVADSTGTNFFDPGEVLSTALLGSSIVGSGIATLTSTNQPPGSGPRTGQSVQSESAVLTFTYDDSAMTNTTDGTHTKFYWEGLVHNQYSINSSNSFINANVSIDIIGGGYVRNAVTDFGPFYATNSVFTGSIRAKVSGFGFSGGPAEGITPATNSQPQIH